MKPILAFLLCVPFLGLSQDFSGEDYIFLKRHEHIKIQLNNNKFNIAKNISEQAQYLTAKKLYFANESIGYDSFTSIENIEAFRHIYLLFRTERIFFITF